MATIARQPAGQLLQARQGLAQLTHTGGHIARQWTVTIGQPAQRPLPLANPGADYGQIGGHLLHFPAHPGQVLQQRLHLGGDLGKTAQGAEQWTVRLAQFIGNHAHIAEHRRDLPELLLRLSQQRIQIGRALEGQHRLIRQHRLIGRSHADFKTGVADQIGLDFGGRVLTDARLVFPIQNQLDANPVVVGNGQVAHFADLQPGQRHRGCPGQAAHIVEKSVQGVSLAEQAQLAVGHPQDDEQQAHGRQDQQSGRPLITAVTGANGRFKHDRGGHSARPGDRGGRPDRPRGPPLGRSPGP